MKEENTSKKVKAVESCKFEDQVTTPPEFDFNERWIKDVLDYERQTRFRNIADRKCEKRVEYTLDELETFIRLCREKGATHFGYDADGERLYCMGTREEYEEEHIARLLHAERLLMSTTDPLCEKRDIEDIKSGYKHERKCLGMIKKQLERYKKAGKGEILQKYGGSK